MFPTDLCRAAVAGSLFLTAAFAPGLATSATAAAVETSSPSQASAKTSQAAPAAVDSEHLALRDAIWRLERLLRDRLARASQSGPRPLPGDAKAAELEELLAVLRRGASARVASEGGDLARKATALAPLLHQLETRERAAEGANASTSPWEPSAARTVVDAGAGTTCEGAFDVVDGSYQGTIARRADGTGGELWLRYTAEVAGIAMISTAGSDFDTVVDWFDSCATSGVSPRDHGDDEIGLQARAAAGVTAGEKTWIRIRGWEQATGTAMIRLEGGTAGFGGAVTNESNGQPLSGRYVDIWDAGGFYAGSDYTSSDGSYLVLGLSPGTYYASTQGSSYYSDGLLDELYDDKPCAGGVPSGCSPTTGTPIVVQDGVVRDDIDFALDRGAAIAGRLRQAAGGAALPYVDVYVYNPGGGEAGWTETDQAGRYLVTGLASGTVFAVAGDSYNSEYRRELYQDLSCSPSCNVTTGTPIAVTEGHTTAGVDFDLDRFGAVAGTVTRAVDGAPVSYARVDILDAQGSTHASGYTNAAGEYLAGGLNAGSYLARAYSYGEYRDELYDDVPCDYTSCNLAAGTPFIVALDSTTSGINFALQRFGSISGLLTDALTGNPLSDYSYFYAYDAAGNFAGYHYTYDGSYTITGLAAGTYYMYASHYAYQSELYDDIPCPGSCDPTTGTPVSVVLDGDTAGIDFALTPLGTIAGTITDADTNAPAGAVEVVVWNSSGQVVTYAHTSNAGTYEIKGLTAGNYFVVAESVYFFDELYDNIPCPGGPPAGCNPTSGTSVAVVLGATASGIDFALVRKGAIAGTVRDAATSAPVPYPQLRIYDSAGTLVSSSSGDSDGTYQVDGLTAGNYFVIADSDYYYPYISGYDAELYNNVPCPSAACNPTTGTPVPVTLGAVTAGIDFGLPRSGVISGLVTDVTGSPPSYMYIYLYDSNGQYRAYTATDSQGRYQLPTEPGTWYLLATGGSQYLNQIYSGIDCSSGSCNVTSGTPVVVTTGSAITNIDFVLAYARGIVGRVTDSGHPLSGVAIDLWNNAGEHVGATVTGPSGIYHLEPSAGTYFVSTDSGMDALEEVWNNVPCPLGPAYQGLCDPTTGTPIRLANWDSRVSGVDFALDHVRLFVNGFEPGGHGWSAKWPP